MKTKYLLIAVWAWGLVFAGAFLAAAVAKDVPRMTKEQLKEMLGSENVVVIDVRTGKDWKASDVKIKGAVREYSKAVKEWAGKLDKGKAVVLYCA